MNNTVKIAGLVMCLLVGALGSFIQASPTNVVKNSIASNPATPDEYDLEIDGFFYQIISLDNLTLKVVGGENVYSGDIVIPDVVDYRGKKFQITAIGKDCFRNSAVTTVKLGNNISSIYEYAFYGSTIREIVIPASVKSISGGAFNYCQSLKKLTISDCTDVLNLYDSSFDKCPIEYLYIGRNIYHKTSDPVFGDLSNATEIKIGSTVTELNYHILYGASKITSLTIPPSVKKIDISAFVNCWSLKSVIFEDGEDTVICPDADETFRNFPIEYLYIGRNIQASMQAPHMFDHTPVKKLEIGSMVTKLVSLNNLEELSEIKLPKNVVEISSFYGCDNLRKIICESSVPPSFRYLTFSDIVFVEATLYVPKGCVGTYQTA